MIKKTFFFTVAFLVVATISAQTIQETTLKIGVQNVPGFVAQVPQDIKTVQEAVKQKLKASKVRTTTSQGYTAVLGQTIPEIADVPLNMYLKVEEQGKRDNKVTTITICAMTMNIADIVTGLHGKINSYLEDIVNQCNRIEASAMLSNEQKNLKKAQDSHEDATDKLEKLRKSTLKNQERLTANQNEISKLKARIKDLEDENADLQKAIDKAIEAEPQLQQNIDDAAKAVQQSQEKVDQHRRTIEN